MLPIESEKMLPLEEIWPELATKSPYELFQMYFDSELMKILVVETLIYALQKNNNILVRHNNEKYIFILNLLEFSKTYGFRVERREKQKLPPLGAKSPILGTSS